VVAEYNNAIKSRSIYWYNLSDNLGIYTAEDFRWSDTLSLPVPLTLRWEKEDGSVVPLGSAYLHPKRNSLTTINVTLPATQSTRASIILTDSAFYGGNVVQF
jgi:hypothetical protein